ncbi:MAG: hypothetical protein HON04_20655 [Planctomicrobium sp.]|jgi:hypothetical protein|nr:hypothetical protein [Planctomicrobium sp.]
MSNAPFKIAFWMMSFAFGLTILLVGLKPEEIRFALNPSMRPQISPENKYEENVNVTAKIENRLGTTGSVKSVAIAPLSIPEAKPQHVGESQLLPTPSNEYYSFVQANEPKPIRVASADMNAPLGIGTPEIEETSILVPIPDARFVYSDSSSKLALKKPVPNPVDVSSMRYQVSLNDEIAELKGHVLRLKLAQTRQDFEEVRRFHVKDDFKQVQAELDELKEQIQEFKQLRSAIVEDFRETSEVQKYERSEPVIVQAENKTGQSEFSDSQEIVNRESIIKVTPSETENIFHFHFENAKINEVLQTLGKYGGRTVVLSSGVTGTFTGEFKETTPNQAFASVIKANQFGLSFRGDHILVRAERDPNIR